MLYEVIIPAAGQGKRMKAGRNKLFIEISNVPIIVYTLRIFEADPNCRGIILTINPEEKPIFQSIIDTYQLGKEIKLVPGGQERQQSVRNGLHNVSGTELVLVHDGARPFIERALIADLTEAAYEHGSAIPAVPVKDTIKKATNNTVEETVERSSLWAVQTPQAFRFSILKRAHEEAEKEGYLGTDDASLVEIIGEKVVIVEGDYDNIKITTQEDLYFAEAILLKNKRQQREKE
ncbi:2-C-methyl-D-erythritol 4-phosphate cytidylyltransferase [Peribacillus saganii]|uniref:2-C-methyl-D-erythritol 4-phosphate cytidylyltransferase n=1 Tax=Peribacillus saganii TaxID=2303992 RepID=A0A372LMR2_9BACI|nr:2-C-methyl-D-erythritol 4-phosphate cytidylyltransferase [Peribacillus saganii]RFU68655.1 2-C-methyl-D-erythritol 4-phosphate cytidylyltransferase [Peribacillus saganii]